MIAVWQLWVGEGCVLQKGAAAAAHTHTRVQNMRISAVKRADSEVYCYTRCRVAYSLLYLSLPNFRERGGCGQQEGDNTVPGIRIVKYGKSMSRLPLSCRCSSRMEEEENELLGAGKKMTVTRVLFRPGEERTSTTRTRRRRTADNFLFHVLLPYPFDACSKHRPPHAGAGRLPVSSCTCCSHFPSLARGHPLLRQSSLPLVTIVMIIIHERMRLAFLRPPSMFHTRKMYFEEVFFPLRLLLSWIQLMSLSLFITCSPHLLCHA